MSPLRFKVVVPGLLVTLVLAGALSLATAPDAHACTCEVSPPPEEALEQSEEVFSGEVVEISEISDRGLSVRFSVSEVWKGVEQREIEVTTSRGGSAACGYEFTEGQEYLVYTTESQFSDGPETATGLCHRTTALADAGEDLDALGEGTPGSELADVDPGEDGSDGDASLGLSAWLLGGGASVIGFILLALRFLRR